MGKEGPFATTTSYVNRKGYKYVYVLYLRKYSDSFLQKDILHFHSIHRRSIASNRPRTRPSPQYKESLPLDSEVCSMKLVR